MTDDATHDLPDDVLALLDNEVIWAEVDADLLEGAVASVMAEVRAQGPDTESVQLGPAPVTELASRRRIQWGSVLLGAAAALVLCVGALVVFQVGGAQTGGSDVELALASTELEPDATGQAAVTSTPNGTRILLSTSGLPPAPEGSYYEAWLRTGPEFGVSAGTFHLRSGGDAEIELWAGVEIADYPLFTITLQPEGLATSSGQVVLKARLEL
ncbi:MAG: hypothetical protein ACJAR2_001642 [Ilumatobacter sp.]|jgi:hypothetical protein